MAMKFEELYRLDDPKGREEFLVQLASSGISHRDADKVREGVAQLDEMIAAWKKNAKHVLAEDNIDEFMPIVCEGMAATVARIFREKFFELSNSNVSWEIDDESGEWGFMLKSKRC